MKYIKSYNEKLNDKIDFKEIEFDEDMMYKTSHILNLIGHRDNGYLDIANIIQSTLKPELYGKLFKDHFPYIRSSSSIFNFFISTVINHTDLERMFELTTTHEGSDLEEEFVSALLINNKIVLIIYSPDRGGSIRIQDDNYTISREEVLDIIRTYCKILNEKY